MGKCHFDTTHRLVISCGHCIHSRPFSLSCLPLNRKLCRVKAKYCVCQRSSITLGERERQLPWHQSFSKLHLPKTKECFFFDLGFVFCLGLGKVAVHLTRHERTWERKNINETKYHGHGHHVRLLWSTTCGSVASAQRMKEWFPLSQCPRAARHLHVMVLNWLKTSGKLDMSRYIMENFLLWCEAEKELCSSHTAENCEDQIRLRRQRTEPLVYFSVCTSRNNTENGGRPTRSFQEGTANAED